MVSQFNPILYMVNALRYAMIGQQEVSLALSMTMIGSMFIFLVILNLSMLKKGIGMRE